MSHQNKHLLLAATVATLLAACGQAPTSVQEPTVPFDGQSDEAALENEVQRDGGSIAIEPLPGRVIAQSTGGAASAYGFIKLAQVKPPKTESGLELRAAQVDVSGTTVTVAYTREGSTFAGAVDVFDVSSVQNPKLVYRAVFPDTKVNAALSGPDGKLYLAGARPVGVSGLANPSLMLELRRDTNTATQTGLPGWAGTDLALVGSHLFFTGGNSACVGEGDRKGGTGALELASKTRTALDLHCNAQSVDVAANSDHDEDEDDDDHGEGLKTQDKEPDEKDAKYQRAVALQAGQAGKLRVFSVNNGKLASGVKTLEIGAVTPEEGKNTVDLQGSIAFVAMGEAGLKAFNLRDMSSKPVYQLGPDSKDPFLSANGVAVQDSLVYIAYGGGGLRVASLPEEGANLNLLGQLGVGGSANDVAVAGNLIFIAGGEGGLTIALRTLGEPRTEFSGALKPILECVSENADGTLTGHFGYLNDNPFPVRVDVGSSNRFSPSPDAKGQPSVFLPGRSPYYPNAAFKVVFDKTQMMVWNLKGRTSTASSNPAQRCK